jgi:ABC-2 type transport system ATP-binding protein
MTSITIVSSMSTTSRVRVRTPEPEKLIALLSGAVVEQAADGAFVVSGVEASLVGEAALRAGVVLHELVTERPDLERVFLELTQGKATIR